jgi:hypothetical protein
MRGFEMADMIVPPDEVLFRTSEDRSPAVTAHE